MLAKCSNWLHHTARLRGLSLVIALLIMHWTAVFAGTLEVVRPAPESAGDTRYDYYWDLLAQALAATQPDFGPYALRQAAQPMSERRALEELKSGSGLITVLVHGNVADYEQQLLPIRFPLDKGLLGYRVFLIRRETQSQLDHVNGLDELRRHSIGQGEGWGDVTILRHAGLKVVEGGTYEGLFGMLAAGRFELFSRGVVEVREELARQKTGHPELTIERHLLLYYPLARYFYVTRSPNGEALAQRISVGLERILRNGRFEQMFQAFKAPFEQEVGLHDRLLIRIDNPLQTPETPLNRVELWYDPTRSRRDYPDRDAEPLRRTRSCTGSLESICFDQLLKLYRWRIYHGIRSAISAYYSNSPLGAGGGWIGLLCGHRRDCPAWSRSNVPGGEERRDS
jgi:hypothetical protein